MKRIYSSIIRPTLLSLISVATLPSLMSAQYVPMFEVGKTWTYNVETYSEFTPSEYHTKTLRVDDIKTIDGKDYFVVNTYINNATEPEPRPYGYFREDIESKQVFFHPNGDECSALDEGQFGGGGGYIDWNSENLLYDFNEGILIWDDYGYVVVRESSLEADDGVHRGFFRWRAGIDSFYSAVYEGIGMLVVDKNHKHKPRLPSDFFGLCHQPAGGSAYLPKLYLVKAPDGTVIYRVPENEPSGIDNIRLNGMEVQISSTMGSVEISGSTPLGQIQMMNAQGQKVYTSTISDCIATIPTAGLPRGIYIISINGTDVRKIAL